MYWLTGHWLTDSDWISNQSQSIQYLWGLVGWCWCWLISSHWQVDELRTSMAASRLKTTSTPFSELLPPVAQAMIVIILFVGVRLFVLLCPVSRWVWVWRLLDNLTSESEFSSVQCRVLCSEFWVTVTSQWQYWSIVLWWRCILITCASWPTWRKLWWRGRRWLRTWIRTHCSLTTTEEMCLLYWHRYLICGGSCGHDRWHGRTGYFVLNCSQFKHCSLLIHVFQQNSNKISACHIETMSNPSGVASVSGHPNDQWCSSSLWLWEWRATDFIWERGDSRLSSACFMFFVLQFAQGGTQLQRWFITQSQRVNIVL